MPFVNGDRIKESTTTAGNGTLTLLGAATNFQTFLAGIGAGNQCYYAIIDSTNNEYETGIGTVSGANLARDIVISSSNAGSKVVFAAGTKTVFCPPLRLPFYETYVDLAGSDLAITSLHHGATITNATSIATRVVTLGTAPIVGTKITCLLLAAFQYDVLMGAGASLRRGALGTVAAGGGIRVSNLGAMVTFKKATTTLWVEDNQEYGGWVVY